MRPSGESKKLLCPSTFVLLGIMAFVGVLPWCIKSHHDDILDGILGALALVIPYVLLIWRTSAKTHKPGARSLFLYFVLCIGPLAFTWVSQLIYLATLAFYFPAFFLAALYGRPEPETIFAFEVAQAMAMALALWLWRSRGAGLDKTARFALSFSGALMAFALINGIEIRVHSDRIHEEQYLVLRRIGLPFAHWQERYKPSNGDFSGGCNSTVVRSPTAICDNVVISLVGSSLMGVFFARRRGHQTPVELSIPVVKS